MYELPSVQSSPNSDFRGKTEDCPILEDYRYLQLNGLGIWIRDPYSILEISISLIIVWLTWENFNK